MGPKSNLLHSKSLIAMTRPTPLPSSIQRLALFATSATLNDKGRDALITCCRSPDIAASLFFMERAFWNIQRGCFHLII